MSGTTGDRLYNLLPAIYRMRDAARGEPLRALLAVMERELETIEADIDGLYDNWFVETCQEWVVPYLGDLLGVKPLQPVGSAGTYSHRPYVANTLAYRRRKGTAPVLEQLARDVTGWRARAVEFFQLLGTTQHVNHVRSEHYRTPDLRNDDALEWIDGPFDRAGHTVELRRASRDGRYNIPNLGLFMWRLQSYAMTRGTAMAVASPADGRYWFSPIGMEGALFNRPQTETEITHLAEEINVPGPLRRRPLYDELEARREAGVEGEDPDTVYFGESAPVLEVFLDGTDEAISPDEILICDLSDWTIPPSSKSYTRSDGTSVSMPIRAAVDPLLGRLTLPTTETPDTVEVSYAYAFSGDLGGGPYNRTGSVAEALTREVDWQVGVSLSLDPIDGQIYNSVADAVRAWNEKVDDGTAEDSVGVIAIMDSGTYSGNLTDDPPIRLAPGSLLVIVAAGWTEVADATTGEPTRVVGQLAADGLRPHVSGNMAIHGQTNSGLVLDGLLIEGSVTVLAGDLATLRIAHCTLVPTQGGLTVNGSIENPNDSLSISLERSICGPIALAASITSISLEDCIVDQASESTAIDAPGAELELKGTTLFGEVSCESLEASHTIFTDVVTAERRQTGCVRFSLIPDGSRTPRRYRCQPDLALEDVTDEAEEAQIRARLVPMFTSSDFGDPAYAQLSRSCAVEIRTGAEDGSEMGAFSFLKQPQREANLRSALTDYLRFGLEAGIFFVT